jgi:hypothetical protein
MVIMLEVMKVDVNHNLPPLFATKPFNWTLVISLQKVHRKALQLIRVR